MCIRASARPFRGTPGHFERTAYRKDFSLTPPLPNLLDEMQKAQIVTVGVGKISDIFAAQFLDVSYPLKGNPLCIGKTEELLADRGNDGFFFEMCIRDRPNPVPNAIILLELPKPFLHQCGECKVYRRKDLNV